MKILIVSDTHGRHENLRTIINKVKPFDMLLHCGDVEGGEDMIRELAGCETKIVAGNNDFFTDLPRELEFDVQGHHVFMTHGNTYNVSLGPERIAEEGASRDADIVLCGHTHKPAVENIGGVKVVNPGSVSYPRQDGRNPSYIIWEFDQNGTPFFGVNYL
ncbi:MAG: metallophosphatase family protein [Lachnospiraceae bacterium]|nr:metallophosphatase family protein [Lachnospiraceae bacterium]